MEREDLAEDQWHPMAEPVCIQLAWTVLLTLLKLGNSSWFRPVQTSALTRVPEDCTCKSMLLCQTRLSSSMFLSLFKGNTVSKMEKSSFLWASLYKEMWLFPCITWGQQLEAGYRLRYGFRKNHDLSSADPLIGAFQYFFYITLGLSNFWF